MSRESSQKVNSELFSLEPTALLEFFVIYYDYVNTPDDKLYIHGGTNGINGSIYWQGVEYLPFPIQSSGFESKGDGSLPRPKLAVSNQDFFVSNLIRRYNNLVGAKIVRKRTFLKFLDNSNFAEGRNPYGSADASAGLEDQVFFILRRASENRAAIELELASPLEIENVTFPRRTVMARYCSFHYRGNGCRYMGPPVADENNLRLTLPTDFTAGSLIRRYYTGAGASNPDTTDGMTSIIAASTFSTESLVTNTNLPDANNFATEFIGYFKVDYGQGGTYSFGVDMDDSADFFVNGNLLAHNYQGGGLNGSPKGFSTTIDLAEGYHRIVIRHHEASGAQGVLAYYKVPASSSWAAIPFSRFFYDKKEVGVLTSSERFFTALAITKSIALEGDNALAPNFKGRWQNNTNYRVGDYIYVENHNVKVSKRDANSIPNWEPLQRFYFCVKNHTGSPAKSPLFNKEYWVADQCSRTIEGCKMRFGNRPFLPFGGFPGTEEYSISS
jgi:lambda family phage minor tail protein L